MDLWAGKQAGRPQKDWQGSHEWPNVTNNSLDQSTMEFFAVWIVIYALQNNPIDFL